jgi:serralysin
VAAGDLNGDQFAEIVVGTDAGPAAEVRAFDHNGVQLLSFLPYAGYQGGVTVAVGDVNGDGFGDIVTGAAGVGGNGHVKVFAFGAQVQSFFAFGGSWTGGIFVAVGDVNGDGFADVLTGMGVGGSPRLKVFDGASSNQLRDFYAFPPVGAPLLPGDDGIWRAGLTVGVVDVNGDGRADILAGAGFTQRPVARVIDAVSLNVLDEFFAFESSRLSGLFLTGG